MRQEKQLLLDEIQEHIDQYGSFVLVRYTKLLANTAQKLRHQVREKVGGNVKVIKKRILRKAGTNLGISFDQFDTEGHLCVVLAGKDALETTKMVSQFGKEHENVVTIVGGRIDGIHYSAENMDKLAKLPSKKELQSQLVSILEAPLSQTVSTLESLLVNIVCCVENQAKKLS